MGSHLCYSIMKTLLLCAILATLAFYSLASVDEDRNYTTCYICQGVVQIVEEAIINDNTIAQIEETLDGFCSIAGPLQQACKDWVHSNLENVINYVNENLKPEEVCTRLSACP